MCRLCKVTVSTILLLALAIGITAQDPSSDEGETSSRDIPSATYDAYIVQSGDSLFSVAQRFNTTVEELAVANGITNERHIFAGQSILVPTGVSSYVDVYEVQPGDTLFGISKRFNTSVGILQGLNEISNSRHIVAGQTLIVPSINEDNLYVHEVAPNDSLYSISRQYNTAVSVLKTLNGIVDERDLQAGTSILVPKIDETKYEVYEITEGDSLYSISRRFATSEEALISLNGLTGPLDVEVGQSLLVPRVDESKYEVYVIEHGDSLFNISRRYNTAVPQLRALNGIAGGVDLTVGRSIIVPRIDDTIFETVIVQSGDSLYSISRRHDVSLATLQALNKLADVRDIKIGEAILIPKLENTVLEVHVVQLGDSLVKIAETYETTLQFLQSLNGIADPGLIQLGEAIIVPKSVDALVRSGFGFGIQVFTDRANATTLAEQASQLGVDWVKIDVPWAEMEVEQGVFNYLALDAMIAAFEMIDVSIMLNIYDAPGWSRTCYTEKLHSKMREYGGPPEDLEYFGTFLENLVTRYAGLVDAYEIWKSPNLLKYWTVPVYHREPEMTEDGDYGIPDEVQLGASYYVALLEVAYKTIKAQDADALVISAGLAPVGFYDSYNSIDTGTFLQGMLDEAAADHIDAIGAVFSASAVPPTMECCDKPPGVDSHYESFLQYFAELLEFYEEVLNDNGLDNLPIIVTQVGWGTSDGSNIAVPSSGFEWLNYTSEDEQALYVAQAYEIVQKLDSVSSMFLYNLNGCSVDDEEACFFSLIDADGVFRPAFAAFESVPKAPAA